MDRRIELALEKLTVEEKQDHDKCVDEGLKDEFCPKCDRLFLAHHHFVRCTNNPCPMSNGISFLDMLIGSIKDQEDINEFNPVI